jgi:hypothetical protein
LFGALYFTFYDYTPKRVRDRFSGLWSVVCSGVAGFITYPLDTIRRTQMLHAATGLPDQSVTVAKHIYHTYGWRGFYGGMLVNFVRVCVDGAAVGIVENLFSPSTAQWAHDLNGK